MESSTSQAGDGLTEDCLNQRVNERSKLEISKGHKSQRKTSEKVGNHKGQQKTTRVFPTIHGGQHTYSYGACGVYVCFGRVVSYNS